MRFLEALRNAGAQLAADIEDSKLFAHIGDRGEFREAAIQRFLRPHLPECYGLGSGSIFSSDGKASRQIDIVIYDSVFSNILFRDSSNSLFPYEAVFGNIEVKSQLTSEELATAIENIASVKDLRRQASDMMDLLPFRRIEVGRGLSYDRLPRNPYLGIVFGCDG